MSPHKTASKSPKAAGRPTVKRSSGMDRDRHLEDARHHPVNNPLPHPPHKTIKKPPLPKKHTPHSHAHEEELGPHTGKPGPITPAKRMSRTGTKR